jgi:hypothetical protein
VRKRLLISASVLIGLAILFWSENTISHSFQNCITNERSHQSTSNANKKRFIIGRVIRAQTICTVLLADAHNGFVAALAGIAVAAFTLRLKWSTDRLWLAQRNALEKIERAFVFIDGFNIEITTAADGEGVELPERYKNHPGIYVTRLAIQPRWKNSGNTPTKKMTITVNWYGPREPFLPDYAYKDPPSFSPLMPSREATFLKYRPLRHSLNMNCATRESAPE